MARDVEVEAEALEVGEGDPSFALGEAKPWSGVAGEEAGEGERVKGECDGERGVEGEGVEVERGRRFFMTKEDEKVREEAMGEEGAGLKSASGRSTLRLSRYFTRS